MYPIPLCYVTNSWKQAAIKSRFRSKWIDENNVNRRNRCELHNELGLRERRRLHNERDVCLQAQRRMYEDPSSRSYGSAASTFTTANKIKSDDCSSKIERLDGTKFTKNCRSRTKRASVFCTSTTQENITILPKRKNGLCHSKITPNPTRYNMSKRWPIATTGLRITHYP